MLSIIDDINSYGVARWLTLPGQNPHVEEHVKIAFEYNDIVVGEHRRPYGSLQDLAWRWGLKSEGHITNIWKKIRYGRTIFRLPRIYEVDRIMNDFKYEQKLISIVVESKGRVSKRRIGAKFREQTGSKVSDSTLIRKLKAIKVLVKRRRYKPALTQTHEWTRYFFGCRYKDQRFRTWIDIDEKWFYVVRIKGT